MRRIFGGGDRPTRYDRGDSVKLKTALPAHGLEAGTIGEVATVRPTDGPSYGVRFAGTNGAAEGLVVREGNLMPDDGRNHDAGDVVALTKDVPMQRLRAGDVGAISEVSLGPPVRYTVEFPDATTTLLDAALSSTKETPEGPSGAPGGQEEGGAEGAGSTDGGPEEAGLTDEELDELMAELRSQGPAAQGPRGQEPEPEGAHPQEEARPEVAQGKEEDTAAPTRPVERPAVAGAYPAPPSDDRKTRFVRGDAVLLGADLPSAGIGAGTEGTVTWTMLGPPVSYLVEFGGGAPTKVEETHLSPAG